MQAQASLRDEAPSRAAVNSWLQPRSLEGLEARSGGAVGGQGVYAVGNPQRLDLVGLCVRPVVVVDAEDIGEDRGTGRGVDRGRLPLETA